MSPRPSNSEENAGPNWFWRLCELWGVSWPGQDRVAKPRELAPRCSACHNPTTKDAQAGQWRCPYHPDAPLLTEPTGPVNS